MPYNTLLIQECTKALNIHTTNTAINFGNFLYYRRVSEEVVSSIKQTIVSSNTRDLFKKGTEDYKIALCEDEKNKPLVFTCQKRIDTEILSNGSYSELKKIIKVAELVERWGAGNCQEKAFLSIYKLFKIFHRDNILIESTPPLTLSYFQDHFIVIIGKLGTNEAVVCDSWAGVTFPYRSLFAIQKEFPYIFQHDLKHYLTIKSDWTVLEASKEASHGLLKFDQKSTQYTYELLRELNAQTASLSTREVAQPPLLPTTPPLLDSQHPNPLDSQRKKKFRPG